MEVVVAKLNFPLFSVKLLETYQVAVSYPFLPPSTIVGALGKGLAEVGRCRGARCIEVARRIVKRARDAASEALKTAVILRRARGVLEEGRLPHGASELIKFSDALLREYVMSAERHILIIPRDDVEAAAEAAWHIERLGDTESLVSVEVKIVEARRCEGSDVNVAVDLSEAASGLFTVYTALNEEGEKADFAVPVVAGGSEGVYKPGRVEVRGGVYCAGRLKFPAAWL